MLNVPDDLRSGKMIVVLDLWDSNYVFTMQKLCMILKVIHNTKNKVYDGLYIRGYSRPRCILTFF
jgi:hypothetical protein